MAYLKDIWCNPSDCPFKILRRGFDSWRCTSGKCCNHLIRVT